MSVRYDVMWGGVGQAVGVVGAEDRGAVRGMGPPNTKGLVLWGSIKGPVFAEESLAEPAAPQSLKY